MAAQAQPGCHGVVLLLDNSTAWAPLDFGDMFTAQLSEGIRWTVLRVASGEAIVPADLLEQFNAFVLTGSRFNVRDREMLPWFNDLLALIRAVSGDAKKRMYGGCFGCQVIAVALGGSVGYNPPAVEEPGRRRFVLGAEILCWVDSPATRSLLGEGPPPTGVKVIVSHGDCVLELPPDAELLASSASCSVEAFVAGAHKNLLACQSHPEMDYEYSIRERIWPAVVEKNKRLTEVEELRAKASFDAFGGRTEGPDLLMGAINAFLLGPRSNTSS